MALSKLFKAQQFNSNLFNSSLVHQLKALSSKFTKFNLNPLDYPLVVEMATRGTARYFISQVFKPPSNPDHMPWHKIADIFMGNDLMMTMLTEEIISRAGG